MAGAGHGHGSHGDGGARVERPPVRNPVFERARPLILELAHEVDPAVRVTLQPYHWHGDDVLDIGLSLHGHEHHLQITAGRR